MWQKQGTLIISDWCVTERILALITWFSMRVAYLKIWKNQSHYILDTISVNEFLIYVNRKRIFLDYPSFPNSSNLNRYDYYLFPKIGLVGCSRRIYRRHICRRIKLPQRVSWYDIKQSDGEVPVRLGLWEYRVSLYCHCFQVHSGPE